jgi:hypothetical protein
MEVIAGIFYRRNHQGIQNVSSIRRRNRFIDENVDEITKGFKTQLRTVTCPVYRQTSRQNHIRNTSVGEFIGKS